MNIIKKRKKISNKQEEKVAEQLGGKIMPASGALPFSKSDVRVPNYFSIECKFTESNFYILKLTDLLKIKKEANKRLEQPIFQVEFKGNNKASYAIVPRIDEDVPPMITYNKSIVLRSGDLYSMIGKSSPLMIIAFDRVPHTKRLDFAVYEWNDFLNKINQRHTLV